MRTFELPVSDCGCFVAGEIGPECFDAARYGGDARPLPRYGVIVWYETFDAAKAAFQASTKAHFADDPEPNLIAEAGSAE